MTTSGNPTGLVRIFYPLEEGEIILRTETDWDLDILPVRTSSDRTTYEFDVSAEKSYLLFKTCLRTGEELLWSEGAERIAILGGERSLDFYPHFRSGLTGHVTEPFEIASSILGRPHHVRVYLPAGYEENQLKRYPVIYAHDGHNLFFPEEAATGVEWEIDENLDVLDSMNLIEQTIVVGLQSEDRGTDYTEPGCEAYGQSMVEEVKPSIDETLRTRPGSRRTAVMGSSLGGVAAFYLGWNWPEVFGNVACLSSTFSYQDTLIKRVRSEERGARSSLKIYLDSGWPADNYEPTLSMAMALLECGFELGRDFLHLAFPHERHSESSWGARCHLPIQLFSGKLREAARVRREPQ